ncbi:hypothetical protein [Kribbella kalugense]|uniref:Tail protein P2 I n=1 Tax=Kribbella kalugense TaxID=2512221 RepID=A0A4R7ZYR1_9ACTN|nr:hypothetical protein [Kribbella kalugense]TDW22088.1 hypothetical protein EV650_0920 [Kribbella kalugense]
MSYRDELMELLPLLHRQRDVDGVLEAFLQVLGEQADVVAKDLGLLYDDWFIETCADALVPYIGDLLGVRLLYPLGPGAGRMRALVADILDHRRRKGTISGLERLAYDVTGWPTAAVEYFSRLGTTQYLAHQRPDHLQVPDLRRTSDLELIGGPFGTAAHTAEVRRPPAGRFGIGTIGLHVWRLEPQRVSRATARPVADPADGRFTVDPRGLDVPLFNPGSTEPSFDSRTAEQNVPAPLRRRALYDELEALRAGSSEPPRWFGDDPVVEVFADLGNGVEVIPRSELTSADLTGSPTSWPRPAGSIKVAVDPVLGRVAFRADLTPAVVEVTASFASPGRIGAGTYDREDPRTADLLSRATWFRVVSSALAPVAGVRLTTLTDAVDDWNAVPPGAVGAIVVLDNRSYAGDLAIAVPEGSELVVVAAEWPAAEADAPLVLDPSDAIPADRRPHLKGALATRGGAAADVPGELTLDGFLIEGSVKVAPGDLGRLALRSCTLGDLNVEAPTSPETDNGRLVIEVERTIAATVSVPAPGPELQLTKSIVEEIDAPGAPVVLLEVTGLGPVTAQQLDSSDCVLDGSVTVGRRQHGCLRFSYLAGGTTTPRRYRCQPDLALADVTDPAQAAIVRARLSPVFSSTALGDPAYARLDGRSDVALLTGSSAGAAMGVYAELAEPQREANLAAVLEEYLRIGLDAGVVQES